MELLKRIADARGRVGAGRRTRSCCASDADIRMQRVKVMTIVGTRPEIIKLSRVIAELDAAYRARPGAHRTELRLRAEPDLLRAAEDSRARHFLGAAGASAARDDRQRDRAIRRVLARERPDALLLLRRHQQLPGGDRGQAPEDPGVPHGGGQPLLRPARARGDQPARSSTTQRHQPCRLPSTRGAICSPRACGRRP